MAFQVTTPTFTPTKAIHSTHAIKATLFTKNTLTTTLTSSPHTKLVFWMLSTLDTSYWLTEHTSTSHTQVNQSDSFISTIFELFFLTQFVFKIKIGGLEYLGNLIHGNPDSYNVRYYNYMYYVYKTFGRYFGKSYQYYESVYPSVLYHPETTLRDPAYWMFMKRVFVFYYKYMEHLKPYTHKELGFDGVRIESVTTDKLITYFNYFDSDISNAVDVERYIPDHISDLRRFGRVSHYAGEDFIIKARQLRLNHVPFNVNISVASTLATPSVVRIYLGPKYDEYGHLIELNENRFNFYLLDMFKYDLIAGTNLIYRDSREFYMHVQDRTTYYELYKGVMLATKDQYQYKLDNYQAHSGFPNRLILPMGKKGGQVYRLYVHVSPYYPPHTPQYSTYDPILGTGIGSGSRYIDALPLGYPFDRRIDEYYWYTPNMYYYDAVVYHKTD